MSVSEMQPSVLSAAQQPKGKGQLVSKIAGARLHGRPSNVLFDICLSNGSISSIEKHASAQNRTDAPSPGVINATGGLCCTSFCHAHIHLDKCFLLTDEKFSELEPVTGDFAEAMELTTEAKKRFEEDDLLRRGRRLIDESIEAGVTHMRAFVEVDEGVGLKCVDAALKLKHEYSQVCEVQICAFAQLAICSGEDGGKQRRALLEEALRKDGIDVLGSTPYVEDSQDQMHRNINWTIRTAIHMGKHVDFHLDYNLDLETTSLVWYVLGLLEDFNWVENSQGRRITLGHCTRLSLFSENEWKRLNRELGSLPVSFVGLPSSDLFMMGRPSPKDSSGQRPRGTLQVLSMIRDHGFRCAIAINNIGNCFTPQGSCNPLSLASNGVAIYQAGTKQAVELLFETVSSRAKEAIGLPWDSATLHVGSPADLVIFTGFEARNSPKDVFAAVTLPDAAKVRATIFKGYATS